MRTCARWGCLWRRRRIRGDRLATPSPHCAAARQAQFLVSITIGQSIYCIFAIDTTDVLWYNPFVIDSMCVSSPAGGQARLSGLGAKGFALHTLQDSLALLENSRDDLRGVSWVCSQEPVDRAGPCKGIGLPSGSFHIHIMARTGGKERYVPAVLHRPGHV